MQNSENQVITGKTVQDKELTNVLRLSLQNKLVKFNCTTAIVWLLAWRLAVSEWDFSTGRRIKPWDICWSNVKMDLET